MENVIANWKTTVAALITAIGLLLKVVFPNSGEVIDQAGNVMIAVGPVLGLLFAKDSSVTGTAANPRAQEQGLPDPPPKV